MKFSFSRSEKCLQGVRDRVYSDPEKKKIEIVWECE
jgi:hypothetical protein